MAFIDRSYEKFGKAWQYQVLNSSQMLLVTVISAKSIWMAKVESTRGQLFQNQQPISRIATDEFSLSLFFLIWASDSSKHILHMLSVIYRSLMGRNDARL